MCKGSGNKGKRVPLDAVVQEAWGEGSRRKRVSLQGGGVGVWGWGSGCACRDETAWGQECHVRDWPHLGGKLV